MMNVKVIAKQIIAKEFATQQALEDYLKKHPKSDRTKHTVKKLPSNSAWSRYSSEAEPESNTALKGFVTDIEKDTVANTNFRKVLYTGKHSQLVLMSLKTKEDIGDEVHTVDQFFRIDSGKGKVVINGQEHPVRDGFAFIVPAGARHNVVADTEMKLYSVYSPPQHMDGTIHKTKADATEEHFDGKTTEKSANKVAMSKGISKELSAVTSDGNFKFILKKVFNGEPKKFSIEIEQNNKITLESTKNVDDTIVRKAMVSAVDAFERALRTEAGLIII